MQDILLRLSHSLRAAAVAFRNTGTRSGRGSRSRTYDLRIKSPLLYQLSYTPMIGASHDLFLRMHEAILRCPGIATRFADSRHFSAGMPASGRHVDRDRHDASCHRKIATRFAQISRALCRILATFHNPRR
ncbi:hypothetical protein SBBP1_730015 [Burkholderiales bacterium]|nr:hypothetical protein SBBP1_730015 [Burkholderiales bacterium]